ncbi:gas vesicle protein [Streptomyces bohaiensis]|uniref:Gas vesicle protein n=1 Tax=Streptomyces bohaiensis TaxID=1431344 RepID=A0ABX1C9X0_9ACTN|nr:gas vesicle protein [Streptomyces bohaiensis]NJQ13929.1 gas vesicle protein [Streptomyces bohaiensis]
MTESEKSGGRLPVSQIVQQAASELAMLLDREAQSVSSVRRTDDGWTAQVEVLELERVPPTTSVMATYRVDLDHQGLLLEYEMVRRYSRGEVERRR